MMSWELYCHCLLLLTQVIRPNGTVWEFLRSWLGISTALLLIIRNIPRTELFVCFACAPLFRAMASVPSFLNVGRVACQSMFQGYVSSAGKRGGRVFSL